MGILDGIVEWIAEQVMAGLDLVTTSVLGALGCDMAVFLRYFPAAETMYSVFVALAIGIILLNWVWQLFKNFGLGAGVEAEDPVKLSIRSVIFILLTLFSDEIVNIVLTIGGTPYHWIMESDLPALSFADFNSVMLVIIGVCANGAVALITLILVLILAWNYLKLLFEAAERYVLLGVLVYTAPVAFSMGASQTTANIWKSWCRMLGGQIFLLVMNAWCLRLFTSMVGSFLANPLSLLFLQTKISDNNAHTDEPLKGIFFNPNSKFMKRHTVDEIVREKIATSLREMKTNYLDSLLIHYPFPGYIVDIWKVMIELKKEGLVRYIGVSNFHERHIQKLIDATNVVPDINECYISPIGTKQTLVDYCNSIQCLFMTYSPLMDMAAGRVQSEPINNLTEKYRKSVAQIILRWNIDRGCLPLPKTKNVQRLQENFEVFDFELTGEEVDAISSLNFDYQYIVESKTCPEI